MNRVIEGRDEEGHDRCWTVVVERQEGLATQQ